MRAASQRPSIAIIGAGFGGIGMAIRLKQSGYDDVQVFEKGDDVGGVWRENSYPGAACDVPSHLYSFSFEPNPRWTRRFAEQDEIHAYLRHCVDKYAVRDQIRLRTEVLSATYDEGAAQWDLELSDGSTHRADVLIPACGQLSAPSVPAIAGLDDFTGELFHSAHWPEEVALDGKHVAVIGTGASSIQIVPSIAERVGRLRLFQREAAHVIRKPDYAYSETAKRVFERIPALLKASRWLTYLQLESRALPFTRVPQLLKVVDVRFRMHLYGSVKDKELRRALIPKTTIGCKRILISNDFYPALTRPNVDLITAPIERLTPRGIITADGEHHPADVVVLATGFRATDFLTPMQVTGVGGRRLDEAWADGAEAHLGITVAGFPNLCLLYGPNTNLGHSSIVFMLEAQFRYVLDLLAGMQRDGARSFDVRAEALRASSEQMQRLSRHTVWDRGCTSWYRTASGRHTNNWPGMTVDYWRRTRKVAWTDFDLEPATRKSDVLA